MSKPTKARNRNQLSRAEIKAYEARRAAARNPDASTASATTPAAANRGAVTGRRTHIVSREEEFRTIKADMKRLVAILLVLLVVLVVATLVLR